MPHAAHDLARLAHVVAHAGHADTAWHELPQVPQLRALVLVHAHARRVQSKPAAQVHAPFVQVGRRRALRATGAAVEVVGLEIDARVGAVGDVAAQVVVHADCEADLRGPAHGGAGAARGRVAGGVGAHPVAHLVVRQAHTPFVQKVPLAQRTPQPPEPVGLDVHARQPARGQPSPDQVTLHTDAEHTWPLVHTLAHEPQCCGFEVMLLHKVCSGSALGVDAGRGAGARDAAAAAVLVVLAHVDARAVAARLAARALLHARAHAATPTSRAAWARACSSARAARRAATARAST